MQQGFSYEIAAVMPMAIATGLFVSLASFTYPDQTQGPTGNLIGSFSPVNGLQDIVCMAMPNSSKKIAADERKAIPDIEAMASWHVLLDAYYPIVIAASGMGWRITVDGVLYDLLGADHDSQFTQTRCVCQLVTL